MIDVNEAFVSRTYKNNPKLKACNVPMPMTMDNIHEMVKCESDILYFIKTYIKIIHVDKGIVPFETWNFQDEMAKIMSENRFSIFKLPRQVGKTTTAAAVILHYILFNESKLVAILANKGAQAREILARVKMAYEELPLWMQVGVKEWNKGSIELGNGSRVVAAATGSSSVRGMAISFLYLDEFAFVHVNMASSFFESVYPTISSGTETKIVITSTPNGMNHFYKMWIEAIESRSEFKPFAINWWDVPGRDQKWKDETIANIGEESFEQEYAGEFMGSSNTLISGHCLKRLVHHTPLTSTQKDSLKIYHTPEEDHIYMVCLDTSRGSGIDYSVSQVIDITSYPFKQVAVFRNNKTNTHVLPTITTEIAKKYNDAYILIELNDLGESVADYIALELEYENILTTGEGKGKSTLGSWKNSKNGVRTTKLTKREGCSNLKSLIEGNKLEIFDFDTIQELSRFVMKNNSYEADEGNDDTVMALVIFAWATSQEYFKVLTNMDIKKTFIRDNHEQMMEELSPLGFWGESLEEDETSGWVKDESFEQI